MTNEDTFFECFSSNKCTKKSTSKSITSTIRIHDLVTTQCLNRENLSFRIWTSNEGSIFSAICEDDDTFTSFIRFFIACECFGNPYEIRLGAGVVGSGGPCFGFGFVGDDDISVGKDFFKIVGEELGDEGSGEVESKCLMRNQVLKKMRKISYGMD